MASKIHYQANVCGGDFHHVEACFHEWKQQTLVYRKDEHMFEGKQEVRRLTDRAFSNGEVAQTMLAQTCSPGDAYALAAEIKDEDHDLWLVMAAYDES